MPSTRPSTRPTPLKALDANRPTSSAKPANNKGKASLAVGARSQQQADEHTAAPRPRKRVKVEKAVDKNEDEDEDEGEGEEEEALDPAKPPNDNVLLVDDVEEDDSDDVDDSERQQDHAAACKRWLDGCSVPPALLALPKSEKRAREDRYRQRLRSILDDLQVQAQEISWDILMSWSDDDRAMTRGWWHFLRQISIDLVLERLLAAAPETVRLVLGGPLTKDELLLLPSKWEGVTLWGIYLDVVTGDVITNDDGFELYVGSATGKEGIDRRLQRYLKVNRPVNPYKPDGGRHEMLISRKGAAINLRVIGVFDRSAIPKPYIMLDELVHTILLRTWECRVGFILTQPCIDIMTVATPAGLPVKAFLGLNRASQMLQGVGRPKGTKCDNCARTKSNRWLSSVPGLPYDKFLCPPCWQHQKSHGKPRPSKLEEKRLLRASVPKPADGICQIKGCTNSIARSAKGKADPRFNYKLNVWTCRARACLKADHEDSLPILHSEKGKRVRKPVDEKCRRVPKPADKKCSHCKRPVKVRGKNPQPVWRWNTPLQAWVCESSICLRAQPGDVYFEKQLNPPKPTNGLCQYGSCHRNARTFDKLLNIWICGNCYGALRYQRK